MPDGLYEHDALAWAEQQADLLRRLAAGERLNAAVDWPNVIEEVQDVGLSELRSCRSLLRQALVHLLKLHAWPGSQAAAHWRDEVAGFLDDARDRFAPSMRQRLDLDDLYADASDRVQAGTDDAGAARPLPEGCPFTLDELLAKRRDVAALAAKLGGAGGTEER
jgi:hypothetical protein